MRVDKGGDWVEVLRRGSRRRRRAVTARCGGCTAIGNPQWGLSAKEYSAPWQLIEKQSMPRTRCGQSATTSGTKSFSYAAGQEIGYGVVRSTGRLTGMSNMTLVLRKTLVHNRIYFVLTAFPKP